MNQSSKQGDNAKAIGADLGMNRVEVTRCSSDSVTIVGNASYKQIHTRLRSLFGFCARNQCIECADVAQHSWFREGIGTVQIQGSLYETQNQRAKVAITFAKQAGR